MESAAQPPKKSWKAVAGLTFLIICACGMFLIGTSRGSLGGQVQELDSGWHYLWGDSNVKPPVAGWKVAADAAVLSGRNGAQFLWLKVRLPLFSETRTLMVNVDHRFELYGDDGQVIFRNGDLEKPEERRPIGYGFSFIDLNPIHSGREVHFRVFSDSGVIGHSMAPRFGQRWILMTDELGNEFSRIVVAIVLLTIGCFSLLIFLHKNDEVQYRSFAVLAISSGVYVFMRARVMTETVIGDSLLSQHFELLSLYLMPVGYCMFVVSTFLSNRLHRLLGMGFLCYWVGVVVAVSLGIQIQYTLNSFQVAALICTLLSCCSCIRVAVRGDREAILYVIGVVLSLTFNAVEILMAQKIIPSHGVVMHWGLLAMTLSLGMILVLRYVDTHQRVVESAQALEMKNEELEDAQAFLSASHVATRSMAAALDLSGVLEQALFAIVMPLKLCGVSGIVQLLDTEGCWNEQNFVLESIEIDGQCRWGDADKASVLIPNLLPVSRDAQGRLCLAAGSEPGASARFRIDIPDDVVFSQGEVRFWETACESLAAVLTARLAIDQRLAEARRREDAEEHLVIKTVGIAAQVSDKLNSPLLVLMNTVEGFSRRLDLWKARAHGDEVESICNDWLRLEGNFSRSFSHLKELSAELSEVREEGASIEATAAMSGRGWRKAG